MSKVRSQRVSVLRWGRTHSACFSKMLPSLIRGLLLYPSLVPAECDCIYWIYSLSLSQSACIPPGTTYGVVKTCSLLCNLYRLLHYLRSRKEKTKPRTRCSFQTSRNSHRTSEFLREGVFVVCCTVMGNVSPARVPLTPFSVFFWFSGQTRTPSFLWLVRPS